MESIFSKCRETFEEESEKKKVLDLDESFLSKTRRSLLGVYLSNAVFICRFSSPDKEEMKVLTKQIVVDIQKDEIFCEEKFILDVDSSKTKLRKAIHAALSKLFTDTRKHNIIWDEFTEDGNPWEVDRIV